MIGSYKDFDERSNTERLCDAIADAVLFVPIAVARTWRHGRDRLIEEGLMEDKVSHETQVSIPDTIDAGNVIDWIKAYQEKYGRKPKISEVQEAFDIPKTTAWRKLRKVS